MAPLSCGSRSLDRALAELDSMVGSEAGWDARSVILALLAWGNRHLARNHPSVVLLNIETGQAADPVMVDRISGRPLADPVFRVAAGPAASKSVRRRMAEVAKRLAPLEGDA